MAGLRVGIVGAGGVGIAAAGALIMQGLAGRVTLYDRTGIRASGEALDYLHALPLLPTAEIRGRSYDEFEPEDVNIVTVGAHVQPGGTRLDVLGPTSRSSSTPRPRWRPADSRRSSSW